MAATVPDAEREEAVAELARAFKGAMAARRRMRGRETHGTGELGDAAYGVLFCLREGEALPAGEIALAAELSPAAATEMLESLAEAGLVQRTRSERDRRVVLNALTERGRELVERKHAVYEPRFRAAFSGFGPDELNTAAAVLDALRAMFDELADERAPRSA
ncbi:MAG TPA: MarR family transcriptional regulator [Solirubrobacteraceae bacterium]|nr:MarR family transcriptional regulator [Solirubrobacteraceae bacterium]